MAFENDPYTFLAGGMPGKPIPPPPGGGDAPEDEEEDEEE
jgi:hypothetical protein